jgi:hypothetical protein
MAAIKQQPPANLARYLWAQLVYIPFIWATNAWWGDRSWQYATVYCLFTTRILYAVCRITLDCLRTRRWRLRALAVSFILAAVLTRIAFLGIPKPLSGFLAISLAEGFVLAWAGTLTAFTAPYTERPDLIFPLAAFWLVQALYDYGWVLNFKDWTALNWTVPPLMGCAAFGVLAWRLRHA